MGEHVVLAGIAGLRRAVLGLLDVLRGELDLATGAAERAALGEFARPDPSWTETTGDGSLIEIRDPRTGRQRYADAVGTVARLALQWFETGSCKGADSPRVVIHSTATDVATAKAAYDGDATAAHDGP